MTEPSAALAAGQHELAAAYAVRYAVFVEEQGVPLSLERDDRDADADHAVGRLDGAIVAAGRLVRSGQTGLVGRMAVLPVARGRGLGSQVLAALEQRARERGLDTVELHAQTGARCFYERLGYTAYGEEYDEAGIRHVSMRKPLP
ncbi:MAG: GNAT family N-acetyltransferase [Actinomycetota bacterium]|nr:GNAT family N-acetyltransferase [Actinomycetota bacterium]